jgi:tetratricopeptide (TPR) repeat protein
LQRAGDALADFSVCVALAPDRAECYYNRALAHVALDHREAALQDYDQALRLEPRVGRASFNRGVLHLQANHGEQARADFRRALRNGIEPATIHYHLALVALAEDDREAAQASLDEALRHNPGHEQARELREALKPPAHPDARKSGPPATRRHQPSDRFNPSR